MLRKFNPDIPIYGLYGGEPDRAEYFEKYLKPLRRTGRLFKAGQDKQNDRENLSQALDGLKTIGRLTNLQVIAAKLMLQGHKPDSIALQMGLDAPAVNDLMDDVKDILMNTEGNDRARVIYGSIYDHTQIQLQSLMRRQATSSEYTKQHVVDTVNSIFNYAHQYGSNKMAIRILYRLIDEAGSVEDSPSNNIVGQFIYGAQENYYRSYRTLLILTLMRFYVHEFTSENLAEVVEFYQAHSDAMF